MAFGALSARRQLLAESLVLVTKLLVLAPYVYLAAHAKFAVHPYGSFWIAGIVGFLISVSMAVLLLQGTRALRLDRSRKRTPRRSGARMLNRLSFPRSEIGLVLFELTRKGTPRADPAITLNDVSGLQRWDQVLQRPRGAETQTGIRHQRPDRNH